MESRPSPNHLPFPNAAREPSATRIEPAKDLSGLADSVWYRIEDDQGTDFAMRVHEQNGVLVCTGLIFGLDAAVPISVRSVRAARLTFWLKAFADWKLAAARQGYQPSTDSTPSRPRLRRPGSARLGEDHYRDVAAKYREKVASGTRSPVKDLAEDMNAATITVRKWLQKARTQGLLDDLSAKPGAIKGPPNPARKIGNE